MKLEYEIVEEALDALNQISGLKTRAGILKNNGMFDVFMGQEKFTGYVIPNITIGNVGYVSMISKQNSHDLGLPSLIIAKSIPLSISKQYALENVNYLDISGNCTIRNKNLFLHIEGKKKSKISRTNQTRAFQEAGIRVIFYLLNNENAIRSTYRHIAEIVGVSLGSVGYVMHELADLNFLLKTKKGTILKNQKALLDRWVVAYNDVLRPRLLIKKMRFSNPEQYYKWDNLGLQDAEGTVLWGGEPGASILTNYITPEKFTIYTNDLWNNLVVDLKLLPAEEGQIDVLRMFWNEQEKYREKHSAPAIVIYADLMGSGNGRNIEVAKIILENELSYIK